MREHLKQVEKSTGKRPIQLDEAKLPDELVYLLNMFEELRSTAEPGSSIRFVEIKAWCDLTGVDISPFEFRCIKALDREWLNFVARKTKK